MRENSGVEARSRPEGLRAEGEVLAEAASPSPSFPPARGPGGAL